MNNKKITEMLKKVAVSAVLGLTAAAPLLTTAQSASAATYTASKYFPGESADTDNEYSNDSTGGYFRNFKKRSANIYVKDKKVKKVFQKAAKAWAPVFKFKFVKSGKHANFNSSKYANVVVKKDGGSIDDGATVNKLQFFAGSKKNLKKMNKDFPSTRNDSWYDVYAHGHITNYKKWKANQKKLIAGKSTALMGPGDAEAYRYASKIGMWIPSTSNANKNSWNHYITLTHGTKGLSQAKQVGNATEILGEIIGIGDDANPIHTDDQVWNDDGSIAYYNYKVTQSDLDRVDWIYAHPWSGSNVFWDTRTVLS